MRIRRAEPGDEDHWLAIVESLVPEEDRRGGLISTEAVARALRDEWCYLYIAFGDERPVGFLSAFRFPDVEAGGTLVYLYAIEVATRHRRRGVGSALVSALLEQCRRDGVTSVWAGTDLRNTPARRTFEATGAAPEGESYAEYRWTLA